MKKTRLRKKAAPGELPEAASACQKSLFDTLVDGGASYPQFAMVTLLRLAACNTPASQFSMVAPRLRTALR